MMANRKPAETQVMEQRAARDRKRRNSRKGKQEQLGGFSFSGDTTAAAIERRRVQREAEKQAREEEAEKDRAERESMRRAREEAAAEPAAKAWCKYWIDGAMKQGQIEVEQFDEPTLPYTLAKKIIEREIGGKPLRVLRHGDLVAIVRL